MRQGAVQCPSGSSMRLRRVQEFNCGRAAVTSLAYSCTTLRVTARLRSMTYGSKVDDLRFNALRAVQCGYAAFKCDLVAVRMVISLAYSCTTLRVTALLRSMTFGARGLFLDRGDGALVALDAYDEGLGGAEAQEHV